MPRNDWLAIGFRKLLERLWNAPGASDRPWNESLGPYQPTFPTWEKTADYYGRAGPRYGPQPAQPAVSPALATAPIPTYECDIPDIGREALLRALPSGLSLGQVTGMPTKEEIAGADEIIRGDSAKPRSPIMYMRRPEEWSGGEVYYRGQLGAHILPPKEGQPKNTPLDRLRAILAARKTTAPNERPRVVPGATAEVASPLGGPLVLRTPVETLYEEAGAPVEGTTPKGPPVFGSTTEERAIGKKEAELFRIMATTAQELKWGRIAGPPGDPTMAYAVSVSKNLPPERRRMVVNEHLRAAEELWFLRHPEYADYRGAVPTELLYMVNLADAARGLRHGPETMDRKASVNALNQLSLFAQRLATGRYPIISALAKELGYPDLREIKELRSHIKETKTVERVSPRARVDPETLRSYELSSHEDQTLRFALTTLKMVPGGEPLLSAISPKGLRHFEAMLGSPKGLGAWASEIGGQFAGAIITLTPIFRALRSVAGATTAGQQFLAAYPHLSESLFTGVALGIGGGATQLSNQIASGRIDLDRLYTEVFKDALAGLAFGAVLGYVRRIWNAATTALQRGQVRRALLSALGLPKDTLTNEDFGLLLRFLPKAESGVLPTKIEYLKAIHRVASRHREAGGPIFRALYEQVAGRPWVQPARLALAKPEPGLLKKVFARLQGEAGVFQLPTVPIEGAPDYYSPPTPAQISTVEEAGQYFASLVPEFTRRAMAVFSGYNEVQRDEMVQEAVVIAWKDLVRLRQKGIANQVRPSSLLYWAIQHVRAGNLALGSRTTDAMAEATRIRGRTTIAPLEKIGDTLVDRRVILPSEIVRIRHDYTGFLRHGGLTPIEKTVLLRLARGYTGSEIARQLGVTKGYVTQIRGRIQEKIEKYLPGIAPPEARERMTQRWAYSERGMPESAVLGDKELSADFLERGGLTPREKNVFLMLSRGYRPVDIAKELHVERSYISGIRWRIQTKVRRYLSDRAERVKERSIRQTREKTEQLKKVKMWLEKRRLEPVRAR